MRITRLRVLVSLVLTGLLLAWLPPTPGESSAARFGPVIQLTASGRFSIDPQIALDEAGATIIVGWESPPNVYSVVGDVDAGVQWGAKVRLGTGAGIDVAAEGGATVGAFLKPDGGLVLAGPAGDLSRVAADVGSDPATIFLPLVRHDLIGRSPDHDSVQAVFALQFRDARPARLLQVAAGLPDDGTVVRRSVAWFPAAVAPPAGALYRAPSVAALPVEATGGSGIPLLYAALAVPFTSNPADPSCTQAAAPEMRARHTVYVYRSTDGGETWSRSVAYRRGVAIGDVRMAASSAGVHVTWTAAAPGESTHVWYRRCCLAVNACDPPVKLTSAPGAWTNEDVAARATHVFSGYSQDGELWGRYSPDGGATWSEPILVPGDYGTAGHWRMAATDRGVHNVFHADGSGKHQIYYTFGWW